MKKGKIDSEKNKADDNFKFKEVSLSSLNESVRLVSADGESLQELSDAAYTLFRKIKGS